MGGRNPDRPTSLLELQTIADADEMTNLKRMNKISSPERWEIKQVNNIENNVLIVFYFILICTLDVIC